MRRILLGFDGRPESWRALDKASELALSLDAELGVVHVLASRHASGTDAQASDPLRQAREALAARGIDAATHVARGDPVTQIARLALDLDYDTVVVGARRSGPFSSLLEARVSTGLAGEANVPVLVVPTEPS